MPSSKPFQLCWLLKTLWEAHPKNRGRECSMTGRDRKEAKDWLELNVDLPSEDDACGRMGRYLQDEFDGWKQQDWPIWGLLRHWGRYAPPRVRIRAEARQFNPSVFCSRCEKVHRVDEECDVKTTP